MLLLKNAMIYPQTESAPRPFPGDILCEEGKIAQIAPAIACDAPSLDLTGLHVLPGLIDCHTHIGFHGPDDWSSLDNITESTHPITPHMRVIHGVDPGSALFPYAVRNGVTTVGIIPGSLNVVCGIGFASKTWGSHVSDMSIRDAICMKAALGENPKGFYQNKGMAPDSRMGVTFLIAETLHNARDYLRKKETGEQIRDDKLEAMIPVLRREIPLRVHCTHNDMASVIEIVREFGVRFTIEHAWGSLNYLDEIADSGCAVVYGPIGGRRSFYESRRTDIGAVKLLDERGVNVALTTDTPIYGLDGLLHHMEEAVRQGTPVERAMRMITINPAVILGVENRAGSIETGKDANFAVFRGVPGVDMGARVTHTICEGRLAYAEQT
ncbi:MAG: amidohydrolase family protein [Peptococcaceae bacterium]|jgi:imidazolonepropionase-like amidohydrolase|nr:amidohydrolase family protein [Peptococcaceae bacterium]